MTSIVVTDQYYFTTVFKTDTKPHSVNIIKENMMLMVVLTGKNLVRKSNIKFLKCR